MTEQMQEKFEIWDSPEKGTLLGWQTMLGDVYDKIQNELEEKPCEK